VFEGVTGWAIGDHSASPQQDRNAADASSLYDKLEHAILPLFHQHRDGYIDVMRHAIALNGSFFNSHRMVEEYELKAYAA
jgi:starch phosphorylase